jgi:hypothetical protein
MALLAVAVADRTLLVVPAHRHPVVQRAQGDDRQVEGAAVVGDQGGAVPVDESGEILKDFALVFALAGDPELAQAVVLAQPHAADDDGPMGVSGRKWCLLTERELGARPHGGVRDGLDVEDQIRLFATHESHASRSL